MPDDLFAGPMPLRTIMRRAPNCREGLAGAIVDRLLGDCARRAVARHAGEPECARFVTVAVTNATIGTPRACFVVLVPVRPSWDGRKKPIIP
ncbi:hypothetical protein [Streptomyces sp.]|uniref:hypothetical protein n=1 Tax=Streptomyces sp. TaxID=1931 RepID=UPI002D5CC809|nr:hypothetical protein [Streptomyces sp.]HZF88780.1 hypothetical protein [Streptomyces sp.]